MTEAEKQRLLEAHQLHVELVLYTFSMCGAAQFVGTVYLSWWNHFTKTNNKES